MKQEIIENLSNAIITQAAVDYVHAAIMLGLNESKPNSKEYKRADRKLDECAEFFLSEWFELLSPVAKISGAEFLMLLDEEAKKHLKLIKIKKGDYNVKLGYLPKD